MAGKREDLPTSRAQIFPRARSFLRQKRAGELELRAEANHRNRKWETKDFEKV